MRPAAWPEWRERFDRYRKASKLHKEDEDVQVSTLIYALGKEADKVFKTFTFNNAADANKYELVLQKFNDHFVPRTNILHERTKFYNRYQKVGESVEQFHRSLHDLASTCSFENLEEAVRDRLVIGLLIMEVAQKLQLEDLSKVNLKYAVDTARHYDLVKEQKTSTASVNAVSGPTPHSSKQRGRGGAYKSSRGNNNFRGNSHFHPQRGQNSRVSSCGNCGYQHAKQSQCPARGKTCKKCNKQNHFARVCRSGKNINEVETFFTEAVTEENEEVFFMGSVFDINSVRQEAEPPWFVDINLCGLSTIFKIDTGANVSVVSHNIYQKLCPKPKLTKSNAILRGPGGLIHHEGEFQACFSHRSTSVNARCSVIDSSENLLSRDIAGKLQVVQRINSIRKPLHPEPDPLFSDLDINPVKCSPVHITITEDAKPFSIATARRVLTLTLTLTLTHSQQGRSRTGQT